MPCHVSIYVACKNIFAPICKMKLISRKKPKLVLETLGRRGLNDLHTFDDLKDLKNFL